ncbi:zinc finger domain-containing protein [Actinomadura hibisca]|uniref:zinc finger domain-containing protein n=1 Tax=Actinomadura hibisca TaxID=68565 RepID=UPI000832C64D|nr:hypothetical protein [Actinomadura hibisca]
MGKPGQKKPVREKRPTVQLRDVRPNEVRCPRCLARAGTACRNQRGETVGAHADRVRAAAEKGQRPSRDAVEQRQLQDYLAGAAEPVAGGARNRMDELFAGRREAATTRGRSSARQHRENGL